MEQPNQVAEAVQAQRPGDTVTLTLARADGAEEVDVVLGENPDDPETAMLGILMGSQPVEDIEVEYNLNDVGGPSAGMMFSLAVIDKLSPGELNGGRYVAGTGTISPDGVVGPIGASPTRSTPPRRKGRSCSSPRGTTAPKPSAGTTATWSWRRWTPSSTPSSRWKPSAPVATWMSASLRPRGAPRRC